MIAINTEIPRLPLADDIRRPAQANYIGQRDAIQDWMESVDAVSATSVQVEDPGVRLIVLQIAAGRMIEEQQERPTDRPLARDIRVRLATLSGRPLASQTDKAAHFKGVKVGLRPLNSPDLRALEARGGSAIIVRDYPASFEVDLPTAVRLLGRYGYRLSGPDPDRWFLYEVGGPLEEDAAAWLEAEARDRDDATLLARARTIRGAEAPARKGK